ncbi:nitrogenase-stabilizing/protective protein NifW [Mangrovibacter yixingensis]|uniref:nitrogenase-stabilizing/protective protein NifW n=1 Tax=Mangrovibacter yixingensis TaxID=1529639 RepID=UPI001CFB4CA8|nr:nitrogenase-stabilizing/protective protein NifW [Mangrovibacter yixingensis]
MEWFYQLPGVNALDSLESFFSFFDVPCEPERLQRASVLILREFRQRLQDAVPLRNSLESDTDPAWQLARRLLNESYLAVCEEQGVLHD